MYLFNYIKYRDINKAYYAIPFEKEAYANEEDYDYIQKRRLYSWIKYIK